MNNNPNLTPQPAQELMPEELNVYSIEKVEALRTRQLGVLNGLRESATGLNQQYIDAYYAAVDNSIEEFLAEQGIDNTSPNYDEIRRLFRDASVGQADHGCIPLLEWENSPASIGTSPHETKSQRELFEEVIAARLNNQSSPNPDTVLDDAELERMQEEAIEINGKYNNLQTSREKWATVSAKRQGRAIGKGDKNHDVIHDEYQSNLREFGIISLSDKIQDDDDDTAKNAKVIEYLFKEQVRLRELTTKKLNDTKVGKFVAFMNRGNFATRVAKGVGLGVAVGVTGGFFLGAVGAAGAGAAAVGASRFVKGYASNDRHRGMQDAADIYQNSDGSLEVGRNDFANESAEKRIESIQDKIFNKDFESDTKTEQNRRKRSLAAGTISVALGAGLGYAISNADEIGSKLADVKDGVKDWFSYDDVTVDSPDSPTNPIDDNGDSGPESPDQSITDGETLSRADIFTGFQGTRELTEAGREQMFEALNGYTVKPGDSVWDLAEQTLREQGIKNPTVFEIDTVKDDMLHELRSHDQVDARGWLSVGTKLSLKP